jgi:hypothetical protein
MADSLSSQEKVALIAENLQEVLKPNIIEDVVVKQNRPLIVYWGEHPLLSCPILALFEEGIAKLTSGFLIQAQQPRVVLTAGILFPW